MVKLVNMVTGEKVEVSDAKKCNSPLMWEIDRWITERDRLEPTVIPKAKLYRLAINIAFLVTLFLSVITILPIVVYIMTREHETICMLISEAAGVMMAIGILLTAILVLAKYIWKRKLEKVGLMIPIEYD